MEDPDSIRFPIGHYHLPETYPPEMQTEWISAIESLPTWLEQSLEGVHPLHYGETYRPHGWTIRQLIHHIADSHLHAYMWVKWALTEENPVIKTYDEGLWADLEDALETDPKVSMQLIQALHCRWGKLLRNLDPADWERSVYHPEQERSIPIWELVDQYAWHGRHHLEQIRKWRLRRVEKQEK